MLTFSNRGRKTTAMVHCAKTQEISWSMIIFPFIYNTMSIKKIYQYPDPILRKETEKVTSFDEDLAKLIEDMVETMYEAPGIGLAAPQIGQSSIMLSGSPKGPGMCLKLSCIPTTKPLECSSSRMPRGWIAAYVPYWKVTFHPHS